VGTCAYSRGVRRGRLVGLWDRSSGRRLGVTALVPLLYMGCGLSLDVGPPEDAGDASVVARDAGGARDSGRAGDAGSPDAASCAPAGSPVERESASPGTPDTTAVTVSPAFWSGWRFGVPPCGMHLQQVGMNGDGEGGTYFVALVALDGPSDRPDAPDLTGADVLRVELFDLPGGAAPMDHVVPTDILLDGGTYAVVFGSGAFGADTGRAGIRGGHVRPPGSQLIFTLRQSDGEFIFQSPAHRIWVSGTAR